MKSRKCARADCPNGQLLNVVVLGLAARNVCPDDRVRAICEHKGVIDLETMHLCSKCWIRYLDECWATMVGGEG